MSRPSVQRSAPEQMSHDRETRGRAYLAVAALLAVGALTALHRGHGLAFVLLAGAATCAAATSARRFRRAQDARIGNAAEQRVIAALEPLRREGYDTHFNVGWPGYGDIDFVVIAPGRKPRLIVAGETKTSRYNDWHLRRTLRGARMLARGGPCAAVLVTITPRETVVHHGVHICSIDRLQAVVRSLARTHDARRARDARPLRAGATRSNVQ